MKVVSKTIWEHSEEKRVFLRTILLNSVTIDFFSNPLKETMLELINDLSPAHVKVLWAFSSGKLRGSQGFNSTDALLNVIKDIRKLDVDAITSDLVKKGLLDRELEYQHTFEISGLGQCLLEFVKKP